MRYILVIWQKQLKKTDILVHTHTYTSDSDGYMIF